MCVLIGLAFLVFTIYCFYKALLDEDGRWFMLWCAVLFVALVVANNTPENRAKQEQAKACEVTAQKQYDECVLADGVNCDDKYYVRMRQCSYPTTTTQTHIYSQ